MRPPMTATKNDGISPPHWKTVLVQQKEVLAENKKFSSQLPTTSTPLLQSQSHHQLFEKHNDIQKSSSLLNDKLNGGSGGDNDDDDFNELSKLLDNSCDYNSSASSKLANTQGLLTATISAKPSIASATTVAAITTTTTKVSDDENFLNVVDSSKLLNDCNSEQKIIYNKNLNGSKYSQQQQQQQQQKHNIIHNSTKLKRISSDVSDRRNQIKPQQTVSRNSSSSSLISFRTTNNSYNLYNNNNTTSNLNNIYNNKNLNNISNSQSNNLKNNIIFTNNKNFNSTEVPNNTKNNLITNTFEQIQNFPNSTTTITKLIINPSSIPSTSSSISSPSSLSSFSSIQTINTNPITSLTPTPATTTIAAASDTTPLSSSSSSSSTATITTTTTTTTPTTVIETFTSSTLPLSETEPLLTNIDETKNIIDSKRSICLNKNSASLIFTKKELPTTAIVSSCKNNTINNCCNINNGSSSNCNSNINDLTATTNTKINSKNNNYSFITTTTTTTTSNNKQNKSNNFLNSSNIVHLRTTISGANHNINNINYNNCNSINNKQNNIIATNNLIKQQQQQNNHHQNFDDLLQNTCDGGVSDTDNLLLQRRRSLQLNYSSICRETIGNIRQNSTTTAATNRKQHAYSWYAPVYSALEEEIEQDSRDSSPIHNLASIKNKNDLENETVSLLDKNQINVQPQLHQPRIRRTVNPPNTIGIISGQIHNKNQNDSEGPQVPSQLLGGPMPRRKRIENFFKSLVGRKPSKEPINSTINASSSSTSNLTNSNLNANVTTTAIPNNNPPILQSPEITITRTPSEQNLQREIGGSTTSLNAVQQKLWNVVPLLKRDGQGSTASLHHHQDHKADSIVHYNGMRKCETVLALSRQSSSGNSVIGNGSIIGVGNGGNVGGVEQIRPLNRLRNSLSTSNATCSRCSSLLSLAASGSRYSLNVANTGFITVNNANSLTDSKTNIATTTGSAIVTIKDTNNDGSSSSIIVGGIDVSNGNENISSRIENGDSNNMINTTAVSQQLISNLESITCKLCLTDVKLNAVTTIGQCGCSFCSECMTAYVEFEISEGAYEISCPDAQCPFQGIITLAEISILASPNLMKKHHRYRLNREIELDKNRTWCPRAGCETVCHVGGETCGGSTSAATSSMSPTVSSSLNDDKVNSIIQVLCAVQCPTCREEFCSGCKKPWHPNISCDENNRRLIADGQESRVGIPFDNDLIKCCPMCAVPIEKDEGCAQMMCKRCKHVFCWYCLASLDDDFLLRHYDKGPCKNKLGHSRASVVWHRAQVIGIFAGFGILLLVASPLLLLAAPCIICCKCRICSGAAKLEDADTEFDEAVALQR